MQKLEYASRTFNRAERNYCVTRREMVATRTMCGEIFNDYFIANVPDSLPEEEC